MNNNIALKTVELTKKFGSLTAVKNLSLEIYKGELFAFLGPNGAGKSTSINMICGLLKPDSGKIYIDDKLIDNERDAIKNKVGVCPQNIILWPKLTCIEQLVFMASMYDVPEKIAQKRGEGLLNDMGLFEKRNKLAGSLSGGMQRRLSIILALIHSPEIIILDEPEAGLDPQSRVLVREYIKSLSKSRTVILTTHNMDEAEKISDRIAIIDHGSLLVIDTLENLKKMNSGKNKLEIVLENETAARQAVDAISHFAGEVTAFDNLIRFSNGDLINILSDVLLKIQNEGIKILEVKIRESSLEDIFIDLTGRRLRE